MKFTLPSALTLAGLAALLGAQTLQPLHARLGEWNVTENIHYAKTPDQRASKRFTDHIVRYTSCVKPEGLNANPFSSPGQQCQWRVLKSTGTDMQVQSTSCTFPSKLISHGSVRTTIHMQGAQAGIGTEDFTFQFQGASISSHADYTAKWASSTCDDNNN